MLFVLVFRLSKFVYFDDAKLQKKNDIGKFFFKWVFSSFLMLMLLALSLGVEYRNAHLECVEQFVKWLFLR